MKHYTNSKTPNKIGITQNESGVAIIEFALVAPVFFLIFFGLFEFGLFMYHKVVIENIAVEVARVVSLGRTSSPACSTSATREDFIKCVVKDKAQVLIDGSNKINTQVRTLAIGGTIAPDICMTNPPSSPAACPSPTPYEDVNGDGVYNGLAVSNAGNGNDTVEIRIIYPYQVNLPLVGKFFTAKILDQVSGITSTQEGYVLINATTVIRAEPFSAGSI